MLGNLGQGQHRPVGDMSGNSGRTVTDDALANGRPQPVGGNQSTAVMHLAILAGDRHTLVGLLVAGDVLAEQ